METKKSYPHEGLRRRLASFGIPRAQHDIDALWKMLPVRLNGPPFNGFDADAMAEVLLYLIEKGIIRLPCQIEALLDFDWGTHACHFYRSQEDLLEFLVPYFRRGLENDEYCLWVVAPPLTIETVREAMTPAGRQVADLDRQMRFAGHDQWYLDEAGRIKDVAAIRGAWAQAARHALDAGYRGLRCAGDTSWIPRRNWNGFIKYECEVNDAMAGLRIKAVCSYPLHGSGVGLMSNVLGSHRGLFVKGEGWWHRIATTDPKEARAVLLALQGDKS